MSKWQSVKIGDVCTLMTGGTPSKSKKEYFQNGKIKWLVSGDIHRQEIKDCEGRITKLGMESSSAKFLPLNAVMIALNGQGKTRGTVALLRTEATCNQSLVGISPNDTGKLVPEFLYMNLHSRYEEIRKITGDSGNDRRGLNMPIIRNIKIPLPPIEQQKQIVVTLKETLDKLERVRINTEKNLVNTQALFTTYLDSIFLTKGKDWQKFTLGDLCHKIQDGAHHSPKNLYSEPGPNLFPYITSKNIRNNYMDFSKIQYVDSNFHKTIYPRCRPELGDVLLTKDGANTGNVTLNTLDEPFSLLSSVCLIKTNKQKLNAGFLKYYIQSRPGFEMIVGSMTGAAIKRIILKTIKAAAISLPNLEQQIKIVQSIDKHYADTQRLEALYKQKLKDIAELKQSLLEKAFSGELKTNKVITFARPVVRQQIIETTSPEFAAHVLAFGHYWHEAQRRSNTYGHVKGQKFLHLAESEGKADMGRQPNKDAAGPNDFQHMLRAEEWAKSQQFFEFVQRRTGNGYDFKKLANYNAMIGNSLAAIKPYKDKLEKILSLLLPMNSQQAEVLATVHAAWNNLLLDDAAITDDAVIHEARDNWHPSKMSIPETQFRKAITIIRNNGIVPDGTAKRVTGQESLF